MDNIVLDTSDNLIEDSEYEGHVSPLSPIHYHFRFTFSDQDKDLECLNDKSFINRCKMMHKSLINRLSQNQYFYFDRFTSGFEVRNKAGENCKAHIHIAFKSTHIKQSMNRTIKRFLVEEWNQDYLGNQCYSFKEQHVRCEDEFWRYPLKQGLNRQLCRGFSEDKLTQFHEVAKESYAKVCQVHQAKMDKKDKDDTLFLRVLSQIKKDNDTTKRAIARKFYEYYIKEDKPVNKQVIEGYVLNALVKLNLITIDELLDKHGY